MKHIPITFIGAGNMASALFGGLINHGYEASSITATDQNPDCLLRAAELGIQTMPDNGPAVASADVVVLAVKPQVLKSVLVPLQTQLAERKPLLISIAAGISTSSLQRWAGPGIPIVRCMPNTPALVGTGATGLFSNGFVNTLQANAAQDIMEAVGTAIWVDEEEKLDAITAVSGSGPAYFFLVMEAMQNAAVELGLSHDVAGQLTIQTALGAAKMAQDSDVELAELRRRVTSPGGTTEQALLTFEEGGLRDLFSKAMINCARRSEELARELAD